MCLWQCLRIAASPYISWRVISIASHNYSAQMAHVRLMSLWDFFSMEPIKTDISYWIHGRAQNSPFSIIILIIIIIVRLLLLNPVLLKWLLKKWATVAEGAERSTQSPPVLQGEYWLWCFSSCEGENHLPRIWVDVMLFLLGECATLSHFGSK